jgi:putative SOS response-associated peptidase YedK
MTQKTSPAEIARIFDAEIRDAEQHEELGPRYNVAPTQPVSVVVQRDDGRFLELHRWGLVPAWSASQAEHGARLINARAETIASSPAFRASFLRWRCIIPADGFYEWRREGRQRHPYLIRARDREPLAFAGIWAPWREPESGNWLVSCAVVTTPANSVVGELHDRMPAVLEPADRPTWLDPQVSDTDFLHAILRPAGEQMLELFPVSPRVNSPHNEGPDLVLPYEPPVSQTLFPTVLE